MKRYALFLIALAAASSGCAALTNPVADGIPVRRLPDGVFAQPKDELNQLPMNMLRLPEEAEYRLDKGDVLGIVADEIVTKEGAPVPVQFNPNPLASDPIIQGVPVTVQDDGTILLPQLDPINVRGKTVAQVQNELRHQIVNVKKILPPDRARVLVDLIQRRRYRVLVVREDNQPYFPQTVGGGGAGVLGGTKRGAAYTLFLEEGRNDLLGALSQTGGPPGLEAKNEVVIRRGKFDPADPSKGYVRIPLRVRSDQPITFTQRDITLGEGDTVYIEARDTEVYYTAGLLGGAQVPLPRDYDLRVIEAITQVRGPVLNGGFSQNAFIANATGTGIGSPNPSLVTVVRRLPNDQQIPIRVDLNTAFRDMRENIIIAPGDVIVLQERPSEAVTRYFTQTFRVTTTWQSILGNRVNQSAVSTNP